MKKIKYLLIFIFVASFVFLALNVNINVAASGGPFDFFAYGLNAKAGLDGYVNLSYYDSAAAGDLSVIISAAKSAVDGVVTQSEIDGIVNAAELEIDGYNGSHIPAYKTAKKAELNDYTKEDYYTGSCIDGLHIAISAGEDAIENENTVVYIDAALTNAKLVIDGINKDLVKYIAAKQNELSHYFKASDYSAGDWNEISGIIDGAVNKIDLASGVSEVDTWFNKCLSDIKEYLISSAETGIRAGYNEDYYYPANWADMEGLFGKFDAAAENVSLIGNLKLIKEYYIKRLDKIERIEYTVIFHVNDTRYDLEDSKNIREVKVYAGDCVKLPFDPSWPTYVFKGWFLDDKEFTVEFDAETIITESNFDIKNNNIDVYAKWEPAKNKINFGNVFNCFGGTLGINDFLGIGAAIFTAVFVITRRREKIKN